MVYLDRDIADSDDATSQFFRHVLLESQGIGAEIKRLVVCPSVYLQMEQPVDTTSYQKQLRKHTETLLEHIRRDLIDNKEGLDSSWEVLDHLFRHSADPKLTVFTEAAQV